MRSIEFKSGGGFRLLLVSKAVVVLFLDKRPVFSEVFYISFLDSTRLLILRSLALAQDFSGPRLLRWLSVANIFFSTRRL